MFTPHLELESLDGVALLDAFTVKEELVRGNIDRLPLRVGLHHLLQLGGLWAHAPTDGKPMTRGTAEKTLAADD